MGLRKARCGADLENRICDLFLLKVTWSGKMHALVEFQGSGAYAKQESDVRLILKTEYHVVHF